MIPYSERQSDARNRYGFEGWLTDRWAPLAHGWTIGAMIDGLSLIGRLIMFNLLIVLFWATSR